MTTIRTDKVREQVLRTRLEDLKRLEDNIRMFIDKENMLKNEYRQLVDLAQKTGLVTAEREINAIINDERRHGDSLQRLHREVGNEEIRVAEELKRSIEQRRKEEEDRKRRCSAGYVGKFKL